MQLNFKNHAENFDINRLQVIWKRREIQKFWECHTAGEGKRKWNSEELQTAMRHDVICAVYKYTFIHSLLLNIHSRSWELDMMTHAIDNLILAMFVSFQIQQGCLPRKNEFSRRLKFYREKKYPIQCYWRNCKISI